MLFCHTRTINALSPSVNDLLLFLTELHQGGLQYSGVNTARSAVSTLTGLIGTNYLGSHVLVKRFMRGIFITKPVFPRNKVTWDASQVLNFLKRLSPVNTLTLLQLSKKLVTLLALLKSQRKQTLHVLDTRNMTLTSASVKFRVGDLLKQSRPGNHLTEIAVAAYAPDRRLCLVTVLKEYLDRTRVFRGDTTALFITTQEPYKAASKDTLSRWIKDTLIAAGVDMTIFTPHSTRAAAASAANRSKVPIHIILQTAGWSSQNTFTKYYSKEVKDTTTFSKTLLDMTINSEDSSD